MSLNNVVGPGFQSSLTFGIADTNTVKIESGDVKYDEYARFTPTGLESRSTSEVLSDIGAAANGSNTDITSIYNSGLKLGRSTDNLIDFATKDDQIIIRLEGADMIKLEKDGTNSLLAYTTPSAGTKIDGTGNDETVIVYNRSDATFKQALFSTVCFLKGTKITLPDRTQINIEDLTLDHEVLTYNIDVISDITDKNIMCDIKYDKMNGRFSTSGIRNIWINPADSYLVINDKLKVTKNHIVHFKRDNQYYFKFAEHLTIGDELLNDKEVYESVESIEEIHGKTNVYNFELDKDNTYFAENYLVHHYCELCSGYSKII